MSTGSACLRVRSSRVGKIRSRRLKVGSTRFARVRTCACFAAGWEGQSGKGEVRRAKEVVLSDFGSPFGLRTSDLDLASCSQSRTAPKPEAPILRTFSFQRVTAGLLNSVALCGSEGTGTTTELTTVSADSDWGLRCRHLHAQSLLFHQSADARPPSRPSASSLTLSLTSAKSPGSHLRAPSVVARQPTRNRQSPASLGYLRRIYA